MSEEAVAEAAKLDQVLELLAALKSTQDAHAQQLSALASEVRAVGAANGRNPIPIIIPCHRVIGRGGSLTGFGGGLETKAALLRLEAENSGLLQ